MLTACNSSRTTLRMLFSSLSVCSAARILCTRNSLRLAGGTCCNNAHARRCCGSLRFGRKTYCGRFIPRFCGATRRPTHARIRPRSPCRPAGKSSYKGRLWDLGGGSPPMRRRPATSRRLPIFTRRFQRTIFGTSELNFCVRNGNRWNLTVIDTDRYD